MATASSPRSVYLSPLRAATVAGLCAAVATGLYDGLASGAPLPPVLALYLAFATPLAIIAGVVAGAFTATFGAGAVSRWFRSARGDRRLDADICAAMLASGLALAVIAAVAAAAGLVLIAGVERKIVGAVAAGAITVVAVPAAGLLALPVYRLLRPVGRAIPPLGPVPGFAVLALAAAVVSVAGVLVFARARLDVQALNLGWVSAGLIFSAVFLAAVAAPLRRVVARLPAVVAIAAALLLGAGSAVYLGRVELGPEAGAALIDDSKGARILASMARQLGDSDGDGFSDVLGGSDCDDSNPQVYPGAREILDNGIDDNCVGGDRRAADSAPAPKAPQTPQAKSVQRPEANVLIIAIDTVRADKLGVAGYRRDGKSLTPRLDALAEDSAYFRQVYAQAPNTPRSFPSMITSRFPSQVAVDKEFKNYSKVLDENLTLFEVLREAGLQTLGFSSHFYFKEGRGFRQGFDRYDNEGAKDIAGSNKDIASPRTVPRAVAALQELASSKQRFAMFVHLFEPHSTYLVHDEFPITERGTAGLEQKYDYEIAFTDRWVGTLLDALDQTGLADDTIVVVLSDHGEAFGVHRMAGKRMFFHGQTLYDELLRVPLIIRVPGVEHRSIDTSAMLIDVAPTLLRLLDIEVPESMRGRDLSPALAGEPLPGRYAYGELLPAPSWNHAAKMVVGKDGRYKLYYRISDRQWELYDLEKDPEERENLHGTGLAAEAELKEELTRWMEVDLGG